MYKGRRDQTQKKRIVREKTYIAIWFSNVVEWTFVLGIECARSAVSRNTRITCSIEDVART